MTQPSLSGYLTGKRRPGVDVQNKLRVLGCDIEWLMTGEGRAPSNVKVTDKRVVQERVGRPVPMPGFAPFLGRIRATPDGKEYFDNDGIPKGAGVHWFNNNAFCLEIDGDSLISAEPVPIRPGDICVFEMGRQPRNGEVVAVQLKDNRRLVKVLKHLSKDEIELRSANEYKEYPPVRVKKSQIAAFGILVTKMQFPNSQKQRFGLTQEGIEE